MKTPYFLIDEAKIKSNCETLSAVIARSGAKILLAQKAYLCYDTYPLIASYLNGTTASGLYEAQLAYKRFKAPRAMRREVHVFAPAFKDSDMDKIIKIADHVVFNSVAQLNIHIEKCKMSGVSVGLRVNPECSTQSRPIYDPCAPRSRFGVKSADLTSEVFSKLDGIHFHTLCEQGFEPLEKTVRALEEKFGAHLKGLKWVNFGGGHHITREDYNIEGLVSLIKDFSARYDVQVYLEPGEAVVLDAGTLHATVLDIVHNAGDIAVLDVSAACHMADILETQHDYTPPVIEATDDGAHTYVLAGNTCLAGDVIGEYKFPKKLEVGDMITFGDTALYTMVKTNTFNGMPLPSIYVKRINGKVEKVREFGYKDFEMRLGK